MIRVVSLVKLTDEGARAMDTLGETVAKVRETVTTNGGNARICVADRWDLRLRGGLDLPRFGGRVPIAKRGVQARRPQG